MYNNKLGMQHEQGFSLIEVLIAMVIFTVIMLGVTRMELAALKTHTGNVYHTEAARLINEELTRLKSESFTELKTSANLAATGWTANQSITVPIRGAAVQFVRRYQITDIAGGVVPMKRIDVVVGWNRNDNSPLLTLTNRNRQDFASTIIVRQEI